MNLGLGGPIMRDRLWFFSSFRRWGVDQTITDSFYNLDPTRQTYVPDLVAPDRRRQRHQERRRAADVADGAEAQVRRVSGSHRQVQGHECPALSAEEACGIRTPKRYFTAQAKYTATLTTRLLLEAGWSENDETYSTGEVQPSVKPTDISRVDRTTTVRWSSAHGPGYYFRVPDRHTYLRQRFLCHRSHTLKTAFQLGKGGNIQQRQINGGVDLVQEYRNLSLPGFSGRHQHPGVHRRAIKYDLGLFVQDSWTFKRLTVNPGMRFELFNTYMPAQAAPAGRFVPARVQQDRERAQLERLAPRFGGVYDLFGDGKTALKAHVGKYMRAFSTVGFAQVYNPMAFQTDRRTWTDLNGDDIAQNNEIGPVNTPFNVSGVSNKTPDPTSGGRTSGILLGVQREVMPGVSVSANWVRRDFRRLFWTDNVLTTHDDYTIVPVPNPLDPSETIPIYNLNVAKRGLVRKSTRTRTPTGAGTPASTSVSPRASATAPCSAEPASAARSSSTAKSTIRTAFASAINAIWTSRTSRSSSWRARSAALAVQISGTWQGYPGVPSGTGRQDVLYNPTSTASRIRRSTSTTSSIGRSCRA